MDESFLVEHAPPAEPPLLPGLRFHLAAPGSALWNATRAQLDAWGLDHPFWAFCWAGGQALARWVLDHPSSVEGRRVLDFGAGCGVAGIAAMRAGASSALCTELDGNALAAIAANARLNAVAVEPACLDVVGRAHGCDVILAADVCYDGDARRTVAWLRAEAARGTTVLLADAGRGFLPLDGLTLLAEHRVPVEPDLEDTSLRAARVYRVG